MAWIKTIPEGEAEGRLAELYDEYGTPDGSVDHILKIHGLHPESMKGHYDLYRTLMYGRSPLSRAQREMIAVVVSAANRCRYWLTHHGAGLRRLTKDPELVERLAMDFRSAPLAEADHALLAYADKLTREPWAVTAEDLEPMRRAGLDDRAILDVNQIAAYFAFVNRIADGLGVELEDYWDSAEVPEPLPRR